MNFKELEDALFILDEHEKLRMELIKKNGEEIYLTDERLNFFQELSNRRIDFFMKPNYMEEQLSIIKNKRFMRCHEHSHNYIEFVYGYSGVVKHIIKGKVIEIKTGEICILDKNIKHGSEPAGENDIGINIVMASEFLIAYLWDYYLTMILYQSL